MAYDFSKTTAKCVAITSIFIMLVFFSGGIGLFFGVYNDKFGEQYDKSTCLIVSHRVDVECDDNDHDYCEYDSVITIEYHDKMRNLTNDIIVRETNSQDQAEKILKENYPVNSNITCYYPKEAGLKLRIEEYVSRRALIGMSFSIIFFIIACCGLMCFAAAIADKYCFRC